jgi:hypothetical protein
MNLSAAVIACAALLAVTNVAVAQSLGEFGAEQERNAIRSAIMQQRAAPFANTHFRLTPGSVAPPNTVIHPLPPQLRQLHPEWRGYMYFVAGDQIAIVESTTLRIVSILPV